MASPVTGMDFFDLVDLIRSRARPSRKRRIGLAPTFRRVFEVEQAIQDMMRLRDTLPELGDIEVVSLADVGYEHGIIGPDDDVYPAAAHFIAKKIDALVATVSNYGHEGNGGDLVAIVNGALHCPVFTYAVEDGPPRPDGKRAKDAGCGIYPFTISVGDALGGVPGYVPFSQVSMGDPRFVEGFGIVAATASAASAVLRSQILQVGADTAEFEAILGNKPWFYSNLGSRVICVDYSTVARRVRELQDTSPAWVEEAVNQVFEGINLTEATDFDPTVPEMIVLQLYAIMELVVRPNGQLYDIVTLSCWPEPLNEFKTQICFIQGFLNGIGVISVCETDWPGALSAAMLAGASRYTEVPMLLDDTTTLADGTKLKWHCGNCIACTRQNCPRSMGESWILPMPAAGYVNAKLLEVGDWVTMARLTRSPDGRPFMLTYEAPVVEGPDTRGGYFWIRPEDPFMIQHRLRTYRGPHHWGVIRGRLSHIIDHTCSQLGLNCYSLNTDGPKVIERRLACVDACEAASQITTDPHGGTS